MQRSRKNATIQSTIRILLADDHVLVRETLAQLLEREADMTVVQTVGDTDRALDEARKLKPDVVLLDIDMPGRVCFDVARQIRRECKSTNIVVLSAFFHDQYIQSALAVEVTGYISKRESPSSVIAAIRTVASGLVYFSPEVQERIVIDTDGPRLAHTAQTRLSKLTSRELEVLRYLSRGMTKKEIAKALFISPKTVDRHCTNLMAKLDIHDRVALARFAIREGLCGP